MISKTHRKEQSQIDMISFQKKLETNKFYLDKEAVEFVMEKLKSGTFTANILKT